MTVMTRNTRIIDLEREAVQTLINFKNTKQDCKTKYCSLCLKIKTSQWRKGPVDYKMLCNACGIYWKRKNKLPKVATVATVDLES